MDVASAPPEWGVSERTLPRQQPLTLTSDERPRWNAANRILFRFTLVYFFLYIFPFPLEAMIVTGPILKPYHEAMDKLVLWVGAHVFGVDITVRPNGSGDTTWN